MTSDGVLKTDATRLAADFGMSRRTFYRRYGKLLSEARAKARTALFSRNDEPLRGIGFSESGLRVETVGFDYDAVDAGLGVT